jgi:hypothetical protein
MAVKRVKKREKYLSLTLTTNSERERERGRCPMLDLCGLSCGDSSLQVCKIGNFDPATLLDSCKRPFNFSSC